MTDSIPADQIAIINEFITEARELIDELEPSIIGLGHMTTATSAGAMSPADRDTLNSIFRLFHSIKGGAGFLGFNNLVKSTHAAEGLLDRLRNGEITLTAEHVDLLCMSCDFTKAALNFIEDQHHDRDMAEGSQQVCEQFERTDNPPEEPIESVADSGTETSPPQPATIINLDLNPQEMISPDTRLKFQQEAVDLLQEIETDLLHLSRIEEDLSPLDRLYRNIHSLKGNCGFMGFGELEKLLHATENVIGHIREASPRGVKLMADMILEIADVIKEALTAIAQGGNGEIQALELHLEILNRHISKKGRPQTSALPSLLGDILIQQGAVNHNDLERALASQNKPIGELLIEQGVVNSEKIETALKVQNRLRSADTSASPAAEVKRQDIRVDLDKLDALINLIGEMVIAENMVIHNPDLHGLELDRFNKAAQHMGKIVRELQEMAMNIRMMPISGLFRRMIRLVHDLSRKSGKQVDFNISGEATEVDKTVIEKITDPLIHLIRNAVDHGLEDNEGRQLAGKSTTGTISLNASHAEGEVLVTITDDGRGMDRDKLIQKATEKGLIEGDGSQLSDQEALNLIFLPGFSTAEQVTDISGRGVGMDVVRQNMTSIKGRINVHSVLGQGTTISLHIPLTLAIIDGMLLRTGTAHYILPILSIRESFRPMSSSITITPDGQELVRVRNSLLPVIRLHTLHQITPEHSRLEDGILIILDCSGTSNLCLFVDELLGQQQTVIKGLSEYIAQQGNVSGVSGCTILGNGEVCLILDVRALEDLVNKGQHPY